MASNGFLRSGVADQVRGEVDVRLAQLLTGLNDAAESISESVQEVQAETERDVRSIIKDSTISTSFTATLSNLGGPPPGTAWLVTQVSAFSTTRMWWARIGLDDPNMGIDSHIWGVPEIAAGTSRSERVDFYIPAGRKVFAQIGVSAVGDAAAMVLHVKQLSIGEK